MVRSVGAWVRGVVTMPVLGIPTGAEPRAPPLGAPPLGAPPLGAPAHDELAADRHQTLRIHGQGALLGHLSISFVSLG